MRPGWAKSLKDSRPRDDNEPNRNDDPNFVMKDMDDGTEWYIPETNITRECGNNGTTRDVPTDGGPRKKLTSHRYGLHLTQNADWYVILHP